jgi:hypothetical protein
LGGTEEDEDDETFDFEELFRDTSLLPFDLRRKEKEKREGGGNINKINKINKITVTT